MFICLQTDEETHERIEQIGAYVQGHYLQLRVFFETKTVEKVQEELKYNFFSFLASLGGAASLYLGISFVVMFELFEVVLRISLSWMGFGKK